MKNIVAIIFFFIAAIVGKAQENNSITVLNKETFKSKIIESKVQLVDVRTSREYKAGTIEYASNIDYFDDENFYSKFGKLDKEKPVYIFCRSGNRSQKAAKKLVKLGFKEIYDLKGGYLNW